MTSENPATPEQDTNDLRKRRERLAALKSKRSDLPEAPAPEAPGAAAKGPGAALFGGMQDGPKRGRQKKMLLKIFKVLTQTPQDENGYVAGTPFTETGVARLMNMLKARSADPSKPGAKVAESLLRFISPSEGEEASASGASVEKLQALSRRIEAFRGKGGGRKA